MNAGGSSLLAILAMAVATYATRMGGLWLMKHVPISGRTKAALDALPPAVLTSVIIPTVLLTGPAETTAAVITAGACFLRLPMLAVILIGVASVVLLRAMI